MRCKIALLTILLTIPAIAISQDVKCSKNGVKILYINGVGVPDDSSVRTTSDRIGTLLSSELQTIDKTGNVHFSFEHNQSQGFILDILEAMEQRSTEIFGTTLAFQKIAQSIFLPRAVASGTIVFNDKQLTDAWGEVIVNKNTQASIRPQDVDKIANNILTSINNDEKVLLVTHSQGNLFANEVITKIQNDGTPSLKTALIRQLMLAPPTTGITAGFRYMLNENDLINIAPFGPSANMVINPSTCTGEKLPFFHGVNEIYLSSNCLGSRNEFFEGFRPNSEIFVEEVLKVAEAFPDNCMLEVEGETEFVKSHIGPNFNKTVSFNISPESVAKIGPTQIRWRAGSNIVELKDPSQTFFFELDDTCAPGRLCTLGIQAHALNELGEVTHYKTFSILVTIEGAGKCWAEDSLYLAEDDACASAPSISGCPAPGETTTTFQLDVFDNLSEFGDVVGTYSATCSKVTNGTPTSGEIFKGILNTYGPSFGQFSECTNISLNDIYGRSASCN